MSMPEHMDKGQGFTFLYASFYLSISVDVPVTFNQIQPNMIHLSHNRNRMSKHYIGQGG